MPFFFQSCDRSSRRSRSSFPLSAAPAAGPARPLSTFPAIGNARLNRLVVSAFPAATLTLFHIPHFRSTRPLWLYYELAAHYSHLPPLHLHVFDAARFRVEKPRWYRQVFNTNGKVPAMLHRQLDNREDNPFFVSMQGENKNTKDYTDTSSVILFESTAICNYMLSMFDPQHLLLPSTAHAQALYYTMAAWSASTIDNLTATSVPTQLLVPLVDARSDEEKARGASDTSHLRAPSQLSDAAVVAHNRAYFETVVRPQLEKQLSLVGGGPYMLGERFSAVDVVLGYCSIGIIDKLHWINEDDERGQLATYFKRLRQRPQFARAIQPMQPTDTIKSIEDIFKPTI